MVPLRTIAAVFFRLGAIGFGGPLALIGLMERECVSRLQWLSPSEFQRALVFCKFLPGPIAYQLALWIGQSLRGKIGGLIAGVCFLLPSATLILLLAAFYDSAASSPVLQWASEGMRVGAVVILVISVLQMARPFLRLERPLYYVILGAVAMALFPRFEPFILLACGLCEALLVTAENRSRGTLSGIFPLPLLFQLFWVHFKAGAFVFGTGLAVVPALQDQVVNQFHWLTLHEFIDAVALGQVTPGPVTITSFFIGQKTAGFAGALAAGIGMYLPGALLILAVVPRLKERMEKSIHLSAFQRGAVGAVIGCLISAVGLWIFQSQFTLGLWILMGLLFLIAALVRVPTWSLILIGSGAWVAVQWFRG